MSVYFHITLALMFLHIYKIIHYDTIKKHILYNQIRDIK